jgi:hypothetical protein
MKRLEQQSRISERRGRRQRYLAADVVIAALDDDPIAATSSICSIAEWGHAYGNDQRDNRLRGSIRKLSR